MAEVGWDDVTYLRKKNVKAAEARSTRSVNAAMRQGADVETSKKFGGGGNRQHLGSRDTSAVCRDNDPDTKVETVSLDVGKLIQKGRMAKEMSQKDLATKINEKPQVINDYEAGRAIPNNQIMSKIERVIAIKLRGKEKGQPIGPKQPKKK